MRELRGAIETQLSVPEADQTLSLRQELLLSKGDLSEFDDLKPGRKNDGKKLKALGVEHGAMVYLRYSVARDPTPTMAAQHRSELRGGKMTVETMIAAQTRIELQTAARCASVSLDAQCANRFQSYVNNTLGFEQMRFGWMYGTEKAVAASDEVEKEASNAPAIEVHAIYEPEQEGAADRFDLAAKNGEEDARADALASSLGLKKVGMVFNVSTSAARDYTLSAFEVRTMAECQARYGPTFVTAVVMMLEDEDEDGEVTKSVSFEPFQVSEQCVALFKDGWFADDAAEDAGLTKLNKEVIVVGACDDVAGDPLLRKDRRKPCREAYQGQLRRRVQRDPPPPPLHLEAARDGLRFGQDQGLALGFGHRHDHVQPRWIDRPWDADKRVDAVVEPRAKPATRRSRAPHRPLRPRRSRRAARP